MNAVDGEKLVLGNINGIFGVKGWVKIFSHTEPRENILSYSPWWVKYQSEWLRFEIEEGQVIQGGKSLVAKLQGVDDRDVARLYMGCEIAISSDQLPDAGEEFYWRDLIGCTVTDQNDKILGTVSGLVETGVHDVLRIEHDLASDILIPFVEGKFIQDVDIENKHIRVDWEDEEE